MIRILGLAMPFVTLQILYAPATNALGRPAIAAWVSGAGAVIMPCAYLIGVNYGVTGMAHAWLIGFPLLTLTATLWSLPVIGLPFGKLLKALAPSALAGGVMTVVVVSADAALPIGSEGVRLLLLIIVGAVSYGLALLLAGRTVIAELIALARGRSPQPAAV